MAARKAATESTVVDTVAAISRLHAVIKRRIQEELAKRDLTLPQWFVLGTLHHQGRASARELAKEMRVTPANLTGILDRLERQQLVVRSRSAEDRRIVHVRLTEKGHEMWRSRLVDVRRLQELFEGWSADDHKRVLAALSRLELDDAGSRGALGRLLRPD